MASRPAEGSRITAPVVASELTLPFRDTSARPAHGRRRVIASGIDSPSSPRPAPHAERQLVPLRRGSDIKACARERSHT
jgi:hypothetical protein